VTDTSTEEETEIQLDSLDQADLLSVTAAGALETARTIATWLAAHGDNIPPQQKLHQLARARDLAALAASQLNDIMFTVDASDDDDDEEHEPDVVPCGHSVCANAYINGGEKECIEDPPEDDEDDEDILEGDNELLDEDEREDEDGDE
jgi:hypothetical protein